MIRVPRTPHPHHQSHLTFPIPLSPPFVSEVLVTETLESQPLYALRPNNPQNVAGRAWASGTETIAQVQQLVRQGDHTVGGTTRLARRQSTTRLTNLLQWS